MCRLKSSKTSFVEVSGFAIPRREMLPPENGRWGVGKMHGKGTYDQSKMANELNWQGCRKACEGVQRMRICCGCRGDTYVSIFVGKVDTVSGRRSKDTTPTVDLTCVEHAKRGTRNNRSTEFTAWLCFRKQPWEKIPDNKISRERESER